MRHWLKRVDRRVWVIAGWLPVFAVLVGISWQSSPTRLPAPAPRQGPLLSDIDGAIAEMNLHYVSTCESFVRDTYADLFRALPATVRVRVAVPEASDFEHFLAMLRAEGVPHRERFVPVVMNRAITVWSRDRYVSRVSTPRTELLVPSEPDAAVPLERRGDWFVPWELAHQAPDRFVTRELPLRFDGGDVIATSTTLFCDANLLAKNVPQVFPSREALVAWLESESGLRVEMIGLSKDDVPDHHIGMYCSPRVDGGIFVADPRLTGLDTQSVYRSVRAEGLPVSYSEDLARRCDAVASWLTDRGYTVDRIPMFACDDERTFVTWNNVLCETRVDGPHVYLPVYDLAPWDETAITTWQRAGYTVHPVRVRAIFRHRGSLRCLTQVLRRQMP